MRGLEVLIQKLMLTHRHSGQRLGKEEGERLRLEFEIFVFNSPVVFEF